MIAFLKANVRWIGGGFLLTYLSSFGQTFFIAGSVAEWQAAFDLSHGEFGRLYMIATMASAATLPFLGKIVDVWPEHRVILGAAPMLALAMLLAATAPVIPVLVIALYLLRLFGQGMMTHIALTATGRWFAAHRGRAVSLVVLGHQGGEATLPLVFAAIAVLAGFQAGWLAGALVLLVVGMPIAVWAYRVPRTPTLSAADASGPTAAPVRSWTRGEVLADPLFWILLTGVLAPPFISTTIFFHQDYMTSLRDWPPQHFALGLSAMAITTVTVALATGAAIDRFSSKALLPIFLAPLAAASFVAAQPGPTWMLFVFMVLLGVSYGMSSTLFGAVWPEVYGAEHLGAVRSVIVAAMVLATAIGPGLTGTLIDAGVPLPAQLAMMGGYCVVAMAGLTLASVQLRRRNTRQVSA